MIDALGLIVISTLKGIPGQLPEAPDVGVTIYVIVIGANVVLDKLPKIFIWFVPEIAPLIPAGNAGAVQLYVVPAGTMVFKFGWPFTGVTVKLFPEQIVVDNVGISGTGLTVTVS